MGYTFQALCCDAKSYRFLLFEPPPILAEREEATQCDRVAFFRVMGAEKNTPFVLGYDVLDFKAAHVLATG
jgi:hypothetical protein